MIKTENPDSWPVNAISTLRAETLSISFLPWKVLETQWEIVYLLNGVLYQTQDLNHVFTIYPHIHSFFRWPSLLVKLVSEAADVGSGTEFRAQGEYVGSASVEGRVRKRTSAGAEVESRGRCVSSWPAPGGSAGVCAAHSVFCVFVYLLSDPAGCLWLRKAFLCLPRAGVPLVERGLRTRGSRT